LSNRTERYWTPTQRKQLRFKNIKRGNTEEETGRFISIKQEEDEEYFLHKLLVIRKVPIYCV
jgi:hypothetical protein